MLTGPEKRTTADQVLSFIVQSCASPRACLTAFLTALLERGIAAGSMRSAARLGARAGCGKPVAAMACGRWLWKACGCSRGHLPTVCGACWARHTMPASEFPLSGILPSRCGGPLRSDLSSPYTASLFPRALMRSQPRPLLRDVPPLRRRHIRWHITKQGSWLRSHECTWEE